LELGNYLIVYEEADPLRIVRVSSAFRDVSRFLR
jgi:hypothetical protein